MIASRFKELIFIIIYYLWLNVKYWLHIFNIWLSITSFSQRALFAVFLDDTIDLMSEGKIAKIAFITAITSLLLLWLSSLNSYLVESGTHLKLNETQTAIIIEAYVK